MYTYPMVFIYIYLINLNVPESILVLIWQKNNVKKLEEMY